MQDSVLPSAPPALDVELYDASASGAARFQLPGELPDDLPSAGGAGSAEPVGERLLDGVDGRPVIS